jgi:hypothetical protein
MMQGKRGRLPGYRGDLMSGGECLAGEQATGGTVGAEDGEAHDGCPFS